MKKSKVYFLSQFGDPNERLSDLLCVVKKAEKNQLSLL